MIDHYWKFHCSLYMRVQRNPPALLEKLRGDMYLELHRRTIIAKQAPIRKIYLKVCIRDDGSVCGKAVFLTSDLSKGPFELLCPVCGLQAGPCNAIEKLAEEWNKKVIVKKVLVAL